MDLDKLPFKIGMDYEHWEFDLDPMESPWEYDKYLYIGNDVKEVLNEEVDGIHLYFKWDVLYKVVLIFKPSRFTKQFTNICSRFENNLGISSINNDKNIDGLVKVWEIEGLLIKLGSKAETHLVNLTISSLNKD